MTKTLRRLGWSAAAMTALTLGCADGPTPTGPAVGDPNASLLGDLTSTVESTVETVDGTVEAVGSTVGLGEVTTLVRDRPVGGPSTCASAVIGPEGGRMTCAEAGLRVDFPAGAVAEPTEISISIPDRKLVGYEFAPHGLRFGKKVQLRQSLEGTNAYRDIRVLRRLVGAYVEDVAPVVNALELLPAILENGLFRSSEVRLDIDHFSGYVCAMD